MTSRTRLTQNRVVAAVSLAVALFLLAGSTAYASLRDGEFYWHTIYRIGEQHGSSYDCPPGSIKWAANSFFKGPAGGQYRKGKSIMINGSGSWIDVEENFLPETFVMTDTPWVHKKGSVKNTSPTWSYEGFGLTWWDDEGSICV